MVSLLMIISLFILAAFCGPPDSQGLEVTGTTFEYPGEVTFSCLPGYIAKQGADMTLGCQPNGLWDGEAPRCSRKFRLLNLNCQSHTCSPMADRLVPQGYGQNENNQAHTH